MSERFSKKSLAKFCFGRIQKLCNEHNFDSSDGYHQFLKLFNNNLINHINNLKTDDSTEEGWRNKDNSERAIYDLIDKLVVYGSKEEDKLITDMFYLNGVKIELEG